MAKKSIFITGGARSGKSSFALKSSGEAGLDKKVFLASGTPSDSEMFNRIKKHKEERGKDWLTVEEPTDIPGAVAENSSSELILFDCVTMWISNLMEQGHSDRVILAFVDDLIDAVSDFDGVFMIVSNEVGLGIVPVNDLARRFRDLAGSANQKLASSFEEVYFMASGIPMKIKGS